jgi:hypothetical protein
MFYAEYLSMNVFLATLGKTSGKIVQPNPLTIHFVVIQIWYCEIRKCKYMFITYRTK